MHATWYGQWLLGVGGRCCVHVSRERAPDLEQKKAHTFVNLTDPELHIDWPIPLEDLDELGDW